uniref:Uncharacterized protein n=1 Tax=Arundo donax TaxID=35708 RepID=A0A0A9CA32_ARUDO
MRGPARDELGFQAWRKPADWSGGGLSEEAV